MKIQLQETYKEVIIEESDANGSQVEFNLAKDSMVEVFVNGEYKDRWWDVETLTINYPSFFTGFRAVVDTAIGGGKHYFDHRTVFHIYE